MYNKMTWVSQSNDAKHAGRHGPTLFLPGAEAWLRPLNLS
jgi:hypothetical protein